MSYFTVSVVDLVGVWSVCDWLGAVLRGDVLGRSVDDVVESSDDLGKGTLADDEQRAIDSSDRISWALQRCKFLGKKLEARDGLGWSDCSKCRKCASDGCDDNVAKGDHFDESEKTGEQKLINELLYCVESLNDGEL
jgi:hypothetical protein